MIGPRRPRAPALASGADPGDAGPRGGRRGRAQWAEFNASTSLRTRILRDLSCGESARSAPSHRSTRIGLECAVCSPPALPVPPAFRRGSQKRPARFADSTPISSFDPNTSCLSTHNDSSLTANLENRMRFELYGARVRGDMGRSGEQSDGTCWDGGDIRHFRLTSGMSV
jgi:hypothetical protein